MYVCLIDTISLLVYVSGDIIRLTMTLYLHISPANELDAFIDKINDKKMSFISRSIQVWYNWPTWTMTIHICVVLHNMENMLITWNICRRSFLFSNRIPFACHGHGQYVCVTNNQIKNGLWISLISQNNIPYFSQILQWRCNGRDGVSNHQPHHCLLNRLFWRR